MKFIYLIIILIAQISWATPVCEVKTSLVVPMPPARTQEDRPYCYGFAATALVQFHYCKYKIPACTFTGPANDQLSVLDALSIANYGGGGLVAGGDTKQVLSRIGNKSELASETCAPFSPFLEKNWVLENKQKVSFSKAVLRANEKSLKPCTMDERRNIAADLKTERKLTAEIDQIMNALSKKDFSMVLAEISIPKKCQDHRIKLPAFKTNDLSGTNFQDVRSKIQDRLSQGSPLATHICYFPVDKKKFADDGCGLHALTISGIRQKCCDGKCSFEYQFYDSAQAFSEKQHTSDNWVPEAIYAERLERKWSTTSDRSNLIWIE